jgi:uncharacterized membrane protein
MKRKIFTLLFLLLTAAAPLMAYRGLSVSTSFPSIYAGETDIITFDLKVRNYELSPQRVDLSVTKIPENWEHVFVGGGGIVEAVFAEPDETARVQLWVEPPKDLPAGTYEVVVKAQGSEASYSLPLTITTGGNVPQRLSMDTELPSVRGTPDSDFTYRVKLQNNSARDVMVNLDARAPEGFQVIFKEQYGSKELSTIPIDAGKDKDFSVEISPPQGVSEGLYEVEILAKSEGANAATTLTMDIKGQPRLSITGPDGLLSGSAVAGREKVFPLTVENDGSAPARDIKMSDSAPRNWKVEFDPESIDEIAANSSQEVKAKITPSSEAITGDYNVTIRANSDLGNTSEKFRITVRTSTFWGIIAVLIIAAALVVLVMAVKRFGRR